MPSPPTSRARSLPIVAYLAIVVVYLGIVQGLSALLTADLDAEYGKVTTVEQLWRGITVPVAASLVFVYAVVAFLRWWYPVFVDDRPVARWVRIVPIILLIAIVIGTDYAGLLDKTVGFVLLLVLSMLMVGFAEEGMFRGLGVTAFRMHGSREGRVALWTSVIFGLAHSTNLIAEGSSALLQVFVTMAAGYFFYLVRRSSGALVVAALLHGLWDFGFFSGGVTGGERYIGSLAFILADVVLVVLLVVRRHRIEPTAGTAAAPAG